jgi:uridine kinase
MRERGRTLESVTNQYMNDVKPAYFKHIAHIKDKADIVFTNNDNLDLLKEHAKDVLKILKTK